MGIRYTRLPWIVFAVRRCRLRDRHADAVVDQRGRLSVSIISGKPIFSLPANIPVTFELIILLSAFAAFVGALVLNGLPRFNNPLFKSERFRRVTADRFFIVIEAQDPAFDESRTRGAVGIGRGDLVERVYDAATPAKIPLAFHLVGVVSLCLAADPAAVDRQGSQHTFRHAADPPGDRHGLPAEVPAAGRVVVV